MASSDRGEVSYSGGKLRKPFLVGIFTFVTMNLYSFYWWYAINRELATLAEARDLPRVANRPWLALLAIASVYLALLSAIPMTAVEGEYEYGGEPAWLNYSFDVWGIIVLLSFIPLIVTSYKTFKRVKHAQASLGVTRDRLANGIIFAFALVVFAPVAYGYLQSELNKAWFALRGDPHTPVELATAEPEVA